MTLCRAKASKALAIGDIARGHFNGKGQAVALHGNIPLDTRNMFAAVITFLFGGIRVLDPLCVNHHELGDHVPTKALSDLANHIF